MSERERIAREVEVMVEDWYPESIFGKLPPQFDWSLLDRWLSDTYGFRIDRLSADYYRRVLTMTAKQIRDGDDLADIEAAPVPHPAATDVGDGGGGRG